MAKLNRNYCKPDAEMKPVYAPAVFRYNGKDYWHPTAADYLAAGFLPVVTDPPSDPAPEGYHYEPRGWEVAEGKVRRVYAEVQDPPPPPRRWTRLALKTALAQAGLLSQALAYLAQVEVADGYSAAAALQASMVAGSVMPSGRLQSHLTTP